MISVLQCICGTTMQSCTVLYCVDCVSSPIRHRLWEAAKLSQVCLVVLFWHQGTFVASAQ